MKKSILGLTAMAFLFAACSKDDKNEGGALVISRIAQDHDTLSFVYNADGTVKQINEFGADGPVRYHDSVQVLWEGGKLKKFNSYEEGVAVPDVEFIWDGEKIAKVRHYDDDMSNPGALISYDSLVYENNKLTKIYHIESDGYIMTYNKFTWTGDNVTKEEVFGNNGDGTGNFPKIRETAYEYNTQPGLAGLTKGNIIGWMGGSIEAFYLSANAVTKVTPKDAEGNAGTDNDTYEYGFSGSQLITAKLTSIEDGQTVIYNSKFEYIRQ